MFERAHLIASELDKFVLVSFGNVVASPHNDHVQVCIDEVSEHKRRYFRYEICGSTRRLRSGSDHSAHLFMAYLSALTTFPLEDDLTDPTGMEASVEALRERRNTSTDPYFK